MLARSTTLRGAAALAAAAVLLTACSAGNATTDDAEGGDPASTETITVDNEFGTAEVPAEPQRALGFYTTDVDILITLGIQLADQQPIRGDAGYTTFPEFFPQEPLADITPFANYPEYDYEKVVDADPDFILSGLAYDETVPQKLNPIAPTYNYNGFDGQDWQVHFKQTAEALDRVEEYQAWTDSYNERAEELKVELEQAGVDPVVAAVYYWDGKVSTACYGPICQTLEDLGMQVAPLTKDAGVDGVDLSMEEIDRLEGIDVVFTSVGADGEDTELNTAQPLRDSTVWQSLDFVANEEIHTFEMEMNFGSPSGQTALLETVAEALLP